MGSLCSSSKDPNQDNDANDDNNDQNNDEDIQNKLNNINSDKNDFGDEYKQATKILVKSSGVKDYKKISLNHFQIIRVIGRGSFGKVLLVKKITTNKCYALKILKKENIDNQNKYKHTIEERKILQSANYPFLVHLRYAFQTPTKLYFVMDLINGGELFQHLKRTGPFSEQKAKFYISEIILALDYLHRNKIIFRDIKPENILLDRDGHIRITDFGLAKNMGANDVTYTICGTPEYLAPEILLKNGYTKCIDWWTVGILLYEFLTLQTPFYARERKEMFLNILKKKAQMKQFFSENCKNLIEGLLEVNPKKRLGANGVEEIQNHPFFGSIDWKKLESKKVDPPFIPDVKNDTDLKYFDQKIILQTPRDSMTDSNFDAAENDQYQYDNFTMDPSKMQQLSQFTNQGISKAQLQQQKQKLLEQRVLLDDQQQQKLQNQIIENQKNVNFTSESNQVQ